MKILVAGIATETNTFSPIPVGLDSFTSKGSFFPGGDLPPHRPSYLYLHVLVEKMAGARGWEVVNGLCADAHPGAAVRQDAYETLRDRLLDQVREAGPCKMIALNLHGAMVAQGYDDCEGDLLKRIRAITGPDTVIGATLDPHCHLSAEMVENANIITCYRENPHTDYVERGQDLLNLMSATAEGEFRPAISVFDCRMADVFQTNREPMRSFVARMKSLERTVDGLLSISVVHGFRRADIPIMGTKVLVITDARPELGQRIASELGRELYAMRGRAAAIPLAMPRALDTAISSKAPPVLLADGADNPGGGSPGDSTYILRACLDRGEENIAIGYLWDPVAVRFAIDAGVGARYRARIGGKACSLSGDPIDREVEVVAIRHAIGQELPGGAVGVCDAVWLRSGALDIVAITARVQAYSPSIFRELGVNLRAKKLLIIKSAQHYKAHFDGEYETDIVVDAPGVCSMNVLELNLKNIKRPMWPFDPDPY